MASVVDICNLALSHIANEANVQAVDFTDGTVESDHCRRFYPIARDEMLETHEWRFATRRVPLAKLADSPVDSWLFAYAYPNLCVRPVAVLPPECIDDTMVQPFTIETLEDGSLAIYSNMDDAVLKYITLVEDPSKFTPLFVVALSYLLASYLAGPLTKDANMADAMRRRYEEKFLPKAMAADARARNVKAYGNHIPAHLQARGVVVDPSINPYLAPGRIIR